MKSQVLSMIMIMDMLCPLMGRVKMSLQRLATIFPKLQTEADELLSEALMRITRWDLAADAFRRQDPLALFCAVQTAALLYCLEETRRRGAGNRAMVARAEIEKAGRGNTEPEGPAGELQPHLAALRTRLTDLERAVLDLRLGGYSPSDIAGREVLSNPVDGPPSGGVHPESVDELNASDHLSQQA